VREQGKQVKNIKLLAVTLAACLAVACFSAAFGAEIDDQFDADIGKELTPEAEAAINKALARLVTFQNRDGSWGGDHKGGMTGIALMAFMVTGNFPGRPPYGDAMEKGVNFLLAKAEKGGGFIGPNMYDHGFATLALSEVWGMSDREEIRDTLKRCVDVILRAQNAEGGWRYAPYPELADISVTVTQIVALASAREAGILVPDKTLEKAIEFVKWHRLGDGYRYMHGTLPNFARTAAALTSLLMCGERDPKLIEPSIRFLMDYPQSVVRTPGREAYYYGHYYAIQAIYQAGEHYYQEWYPKIRDDLLKDQDPSGAWHIRDPYGIGTPMSIIILGVPYRYLPIYQR